MNSSQPREWHRRLTLRLEDMEIRDLVHRLTEAVWRTVTEGSTIHALDRSLYADLLETIESTLRRCAIVVEHRERQLRESDWEAEKGGP